MRIESKKMESNKIEKKKKKKQSCFVHERRNQEVRRNNRVALSVVHY